MQIALYQNNIIWENKKENINKLTKAIDALGTPPSIIFLPEMSFTGFTMNTSFCGEEDNDTIKIVRDISQKCDIAIGFGWINKKNRSENHYTVIDRNGRAISDYSKIHPFSYAGEDRFYVGGTSLSFFELGGIRFSTLICYDLRFPELFSVAAKKADVIVVPACWPAKRREHWMCLLKARAIENQVYIVGINCVGNVNNIEYSGDSCVISPNGEELAYCRGREQMIEIDIPNDTYRFRKDFPTFVDRRNDLYYKLMNESE